METAKNNTTRMKVNFQYETRYIELKDTWIGKLLGWIQIVSMLTVLLSPVVWIWGGGSLAFSIALTGIFLTLVAGIIAIVLKKLLKEIVGDDRRESRKKAWKNRVDGIAADLNNPKP